MTSARTGKRDFLAQSFLRIDFVATAATRERRIPSKRAFSLATTVVTPVTCCDNGVDRSETSRKPTENRIDGFGKRCSARAISRVRVSERYYAVHSVSGARRVFRNAV